MATQKSKKTAPLKAPKASQASKTAKITPPAKQPTALAVRLLGLGLVGLVGVSVLVGLGVVESPMTGVDIKILGEHAYQQQPRTPLVARSGRDEKLTETAITLLEAPKNATQNTAEASPETPTELETLKTTLEAQQQMLRMVQQHYEEQFAKQQAQFQQLAVAFVALQENLKPTDLTTVEKHITRLYLLQGIDRLYQQWQNGILLPEAVEGWAQKAAAAGFIEAEKLAIAFAEMLKTDGLLNQQEVIRAVLAAEKAAQQKPENINENAQENNGFWAYLKVKLKALISIQKVEDTPILTADVIAPLKAGDIPAFWQSLSVMKEVEDPENQKLLAQMRQLAENHTSQKFAFESLSQALADQPVKQAALPPSTTKEAAE